MQNGHSTTKGSTALPKPIKFRLACDTCQRSKIRCDQERPACRRCVKKGIECVYSPARRAGRPRTRHSHARKIIGTPDVFRSPTQHPTPPSVQRNCWRVEGSRAAAKPV
ncbi:hypothetical protein B0J12DRAFT_578216 [Macrophomina phaseolina]|uniref:Zn(2)-C6 fungal-type domain-containing protein n=1 Tax=Macrophomina phaseolina TaxID=35725 RepID=A0ABQ8G6U1_9PEZI|nr:hypothetical protein B0J12DRAFT_578216 [Macrophomina phaseolina]